MVYLIIALNSVDFLERNIMYIPCIEILSMCHVNLKSDNNRKDVLMNQDIIPIYYSTGM